MTDETPKMLPCPFCGGEANTVTASGSGQIIRCKSCYSYGPKRRDLPKALEAWNRRAEPSGPSPGPVAIKALEWQDFPSISEAASIRYSYEVYEATPGDWSVIRRKPDRERLATGLDQASAKAIAQADYEARIGAALPPDPQVDVRQAAMTLLEAAETSSDPSDGAAIRSWLLDIANGRG